MTIINVDKPNRAKLVSILLEEGYDVFIKRVYDNVCELHIFSEDEASVYTQEEIEELQDCEGCAEDAHNSLVELEKEVRTLSWNNFQLLERLVHSSVDIYSNDIDEYDLQKWHWVERLSFDHEYNKNDESEQKYTYIKTACPECFTKDGNVDQKKAKEFWTNRLNKATKESNNE